MTRMKLYEMPAGFAGPGYLGFGGSAGYGGSGLGGISGGYTGSDYFDTSWQAPAETRHDDRIRDDILIRLAMSMEVDASDIEVLVEAARVTLQGNVTTRHMRGVATQIGEGVPGVVKLYNHLHVGKPLLAELKDLLDFQPPHDVKR